MMYTPFFSIVIPTYNRPDRLANCLSAIAQLDYPRDRFEVVVVDDGSQHSMEKVAVPFQSQFNLRVIRQPNAGPAKARNTGAAEAKGQFLVFTDDDCTPTPTWLSQLANRFAQSPDRLIGGKTLCELPQNIYSMTSQLIIDAVYAHYNAVPDQSRFFASNNLALPADRFRAIGGFNATLYTSEDRELCDRWLHHGYKMLYAPDVQIYHAHHLTLSSFWRQHFDYGRGAFHFYRHRSQRSQPQSKIEPGFYVKLLTYPFVQTVSDQPKLLLAALLILSQVASTAGLLRERVRQPIRHSLSPI